MALFRRKAAPLVDVEPQSPDAERSRAAVRAGVPGRCPRCDGFGYIDQIDMVRRTQSQHCRECRHHWSFSFDDDGDVLDLTDGAVEAASADDETFSDR